MKKRQEILSPAALLAEQSEVQSGKSRSRSLDWYSDIIFMNSAGRRSPISEFLGQYANAGNVDFAVTLEGIQEDFAQPIHWADMAGGQGIALRQAAVNPNLAGLQTTCVDLFEPDLATIGDKGIALLEELSPGATQPAAAPSQVVGNAETVQLSEPAHAITLIEAIQYFDHPLQGIANCYNQLADHGVATIASMDESWSAGIRYAGTYGRTHDKENTPLPHIFTELDKHAVAYQFGTRADDRLTGRPEPTPWDVRSLVIEKKPGTRLEVVAEVEEIGIAAFSKYKRVWYHPPGKFDSPLQVVYE